MSSPQFVANYQSNYVSAYDVHKPDVLSKMFNRYGAQGANWFLTLEMMGFVKPVAATEYSHYENELKNPTINARTLVAQPAAGANLVFTLAVANVNSNNTFYPRVGDILFFKGGQMGIIYSIDVTTPSAPVITVSPFSATAQLPALAANEQISIVSGAFSEGSGQPKGIVPGATKITNYTQIIKETLGVTGTELTNQTWFDGWVNVTESTDGASQIAQGNSWYNLNWMDMEYRMGLKVSGALLFGQSGDGSVIDPNTGLPINTTEGLITTIQQRGSNQTYVPGSFQVTDFDAYCRILDREYAGEYVIGLNSTSFQNEIDNTLVPYFANTNIIFAEQQIGQRFNMTDGMKAAVGFQYLQKSNRIFMFKRMMEFTNRQTFGITGSYTDGIGVFLPVNKQKDAKSNQMLDNIGARVKTLNGYSRKMEVWAVNGAGPGQKVTDLDLNKSYMRCDIGAHTMGANQMILVQPA